MVNAISCKEAAKYSNNMFGVISIPYQYMGEYRTKVTLNLNANQHFRTVLTFEKEEDISLPLPTENNINPDDYVYGNNLDLRLIKDDGTTLIADSDSLKNNVEVIDAVIPSSGVYLLQVRFTDSILNNTNSDLHYWLSWRTY